MNKKTLCRILFFGLLLGAVAALIGWSQFMGGAVRTERSLYISATTDYRGVLDSLLPDLKHHRAFRYYAGYTDLATNFKAGHYRLQPGMSVVHVARMLAAGRQTPVRVTINNVRTPAQLAGKLARQLDLDSVSMLQVLCSERVAAEVGFDQTSLFSMFLPNTYEFYWTMSPEEFVRRMRKEYDRFWTKEREELRWRSGLSRSEVMTLASIVYEESSKTDEMPRIAGVYINRLRIGMPLQADPTVKYAMQNFGLRRIMHRHLSYPSPYNTYLNKGLPPSPICMPSLATIDAVLNFEHNDYLYFCARPTFDGYHNFATSLAVHNANAHAYSRALNRRNIK